MDNIIYGLYCPVSKLPVYIGQSSKGVDRAFEHINNKSHSVKVNEWISCLKEDGLSPVVVVLEKCEDATYLHDKEKFWVNKFIADGNLLLNQNLVKPHAFSTFLNPGEDNNGIIEIGNFIKTKRRMLKITQPELAKKAGIGVRVLRELEQGKKTNFSTDTINKILNLFGAKLSIAKM